MAAQAHVKERPEHKPLPLPNTDFYEVTETLNGELGFLKEVRAFMKAKGAPVITQHWAEDSFAFTPALKQMIEDGVLKEAADRSVEQLAKEENELLLGLLRLRNHHV